MRYRYRAATAAGQIIEGLLQAPSREGALEELQRKRLYPVAIDELLGEKGRRLSRWLGRRAAVAVWCRNLATLLSAGLPLDRALAFTTEHAGHADLAVALRDVRKSVQGGTTLAEALARHGRLFEPLFVAMVAAGEASGALDVVFQRLADHLEESSELRSQVRSALLYPALMAVVASLGVLVLLVFVIPRFGDILKDVGGRLPLSTRLLVGASQAITSWWWVWLLLAAGVVQAARRAVADPEIRRRWHTWRLRWPVSGALELQYGTAQFTRTLGLLLHSGVPMLASLRIARAAVGNEAVSAGIEQAIAAVSQGSAVAPALAGTLPPMAIQMMAVGEESGQLESLCLRIASSYDGEVRRALRTAVALIEPAMILTFGALVGFVALAMLQAIYGINAQAF
jgi:type II secretory pathway component PulF